MTGIDIALAPQRPASVSGTVVDARGRPATDARVMLGGAGGEAVTVGVMASVLAGQRTAVVVGGRTIDGLGTRPGERDGRFEFPLVWPGEYLITAYRQLGPSPSLEFASEYLTVGGTDLANLTLGLLSGEPVPGRIRADEELPTSGLGQLRVRVVSGQNDDLIDRLRLPASGLVNADWTFEVPRLLGRRLVCVEGLPAEWTVKAVTTGTRTTTDALLELQPPVPSVTSRSS